MEGHDAMKLKGQVAIEAAEKFGCRLHIHNTPLEDARVVTVEEARDVAREDESLVWCVAPSEIINGRKLAYSGGDLWDLVDVVGGRETGRVIWTGTLDEARQSLAPEAGRTADYSEYTIRISDVPAFYGSEWTDEQTARLVKDFSDMIRSEFPGIVVQTHCENSRSEAMLGPDKSVCEEIGRWVAEHWTAAI